MKERPILFSAPMVRAILAGTKTQTRRVVKLREFQQTDTPGYDYIFRDKRSLWNDYRLRDLVASKHNPYGAPGDRLWVREAWRSWRSTCEEDNVDDDHECYEHCDQTYVAYRATPRVGFRPIPDRAAITYLDESSPIESDRRLLGPWKPGIHMPRWASRITLEVTGVRVERLQAITGRDVLAEGVDNGKSNPAQGVRWENMQRLAFQALWDSINGKPRPMLDDDGEPVLDDNERPIMIAPQSWDSNPWVWVVEFKRIESARQAA